MEPIPLVPDEIHGKSVVPANEDDIIGMRAGESNYYNPNSNDCQACHMLNYDVLDVSLGRLFFDDGAVQCNLVSNCWLPHLKGTNMMFNLAEAYLTVPLLEEYGEASDEFGRCYVETVVKHANSTCLDMPHNMEQTEWMHLMECCNFCMDEFDEFDYHLAEGYTNLFHILPPPMSSFFPKEMQLRKPVTLVLDLDETLVHSTLDLCKDADFSFPLYFDTSKHTVYVRLRPYLNEFLKRIVKMFEVMVFTASQSIYASQLLDILDPGSKIISRRMYRDSCTFSEGNYTKDLTVLGLDLSKVAIIDNSPQVFKLQVNNGIPITSWFGDPTDIALISLIPFLEKLMDVDDVRPIIGGRFNNT